MHRYLWAAVVVAAGALMVGVLAGAAVSRPGGRRISTAKHRCHYVVNRVKGKKKRVRVCRKVKAKPRADLVATMKGPSTATFGNSLSYTVTVVNHGPGVAQNTRLDSSIDWLPPDVPTRFLPSPISPASSGASSARSRRWTSVKRSSRARSARWRVARRCR